MKGKKHIIKKLIYLFRRRIDIQTYWQYFTSYKSLYRQVMCARRFQGLHTEQYIFKGVNLQEHV